MSTALGERSPGKPAARPKLTLVPRPSRRPRAKALVVAIFAVAFVYHWLNSRGHVTPVVFSDELLYSKLAQSVAAGEGLRLRGENVFFPALLPVLAQAPAWLIGSAATAFGVVKALNAALMSAAAFPVYALSRRVVRPSFAVLVAAAAVTGPPMLYHAYLMSEALAYPLFFLACATMLRAIEQPSGRMEAAVVGVSLAACLTRLQLVVVPLAYLVAVPVAARFTSEPVRAALRRHRVSLCGVALLLALPVLTGGAALGSYTGAALFDYEPLAVLEWCGFTAALLAFAAGWLVVPGAIIGLFSLVRGLSRRVEAAAAVLTAALVVFVLLEVGLIAAGEAHRPLERYAIYLVPLLFLAFFAYVERGAPHRRAYVALALALGGTAWLVDFPARAGTVFAFDTPTYSVYAQLASWWGHPNAASVFALVPLLGGIAVALVSLRSRHAALAVGAAGVSLLLLSGIPAYAGDRALTRGTLALRAGSPPDWLDRLDADRADYVQLPGGSAHYGWLLESWNRNVGRPIQLALPSYEGYAAATGHIDRDGRLSADGRPLRGGIVVLNDFGTRLELRSATVVARPRAGLTAVRVPAAPQVSSIATGLGFDDWAASVVRYQVWPARAVAAGSYRVRLSLPAHHQARTVALTVDGGVKRTFRLRPGTSRTISVPACGDPVPVLRIVADHADFVGAGTANARLVAVRIPALSFVPARVKKGAQEGVSGCR